MTKYDLIDKHLDVIVRMINNGIMKIDILRYLEIYENYHALAGPRMDRYQELGRKYNIHPSTIRKYIKEMEKTIK